ncbi:MAG: hypothetical protein Q4G34_02395 [Micrococcus sp.]|nr:hypothetical protein [Micrococcus sp.]
MAEDYDVEARTRVTTLRFELETDGVLQAEDREWIIHWYAEAGFAELAQAAELEVTYTRIDEDQVEAVLSRAQSRGEGERSSRARRQSAAARDLSGQLRADEDEWLDAGLWHSRAGRCSGPLTDPSPGP